MRTARRGVCLALGILLLGAPATRAQDDAPSEGAEAGVRTDDGGAEERAADAIDVQDVRPAVEIFEDTTVEKQVIRSDEIRQLPSRNVADVVSQLAGIRSQQRVQGEAAAVSIEGMPPEYTLILVNGQRYVGQINEVTDLADIPIENVDRIEVLRGAQTLRYGSEAAGGVINIITRRAPETGWDATLDGGGGDDGQIRAAGNGGIRAGDAAFTLSLDHDQIRGFDPCQGCGAVFPQGGSSDSRERSEDVYATGVYTGIENLDLRSSFGWRTEDERIVPLEGNASTEDYTRWLGGSGLTWRAAENTGVFGNLNYFAGSTDTTVGRSFTQDESELRLESGVDHVFETGPLQHALTLGGDARRQTYDVDEADLDFNLTDADIPNGDVYDQFKVLGFYLSDEVAFSEWASAILGVRGELHSDFDSAVLPSATLLFRPASWARMRFSAGLNSRTPSLGDLYQPPVPQQGGTYFLAGNPDLSRESSFNYRAGFELQPASWFSLSSTYFYNDIRDLIRSVLAGEVVTGRETIIVPPNLDADQALICSLDPTDIGCQSTTLVNENTSPLFQKQNLNKVLTQGVETMLILSPHELVRFQVAYTFQLTSLEDPNLVGVEELPNEPNHVVDLELNLRVPVTGTVITPRARFRSRALTETSGTGLSSFSTGEYGDSSWVADLRILQPVADRYAFYFDLRNFTNTEIVDSYQIRGTNFFFGIRVALGPTPPRRIAP